MMAAGMERRLSNGKGFLHVPPAFCARSGHLAFSRAVEDKRDLLSPRKAPPKFSRAPTMPSRISRTDQLYFRLASDSLAWQVRRQYKCQDLLSASPDLVTLNKLRYSKLTPHRNAHRRHPPQRHATSDSRLQQRRRRGSWPCQALPYRPSIALDRLIHWQQQTSRHPIPRRKSRRRTLPTRHHRRASARRRSRHPSFLHRHWSAHAD